MRLTNLLFTTLLLFVSVFARSQKSNEFTVLQWNVWQEGIKKQGMAGDDRIGHQPQDPAAFELRRGGLGGRVHHAADAG